MFSTVIKPLLEATHDQAVLEIGAGSGCLTRRLIEGSHAVVHAVDPTPQFDPQVLAGATDRLVLYPERSLSVLSALPAVGLAILDGDPNYYTVANELRLLADTEQGGDSTAPVIVVHNVGWPFGRRDGYYEPETIPERARADYIAMGLMPGHSAPSPGGVELVPFVAERERLPWTGVRTAVEDFLAARPDSWRFVDLPGLHGMAVLASRARLDTETELSEVLDSFQRPDFLVSLLDSVERERLSALVTSAPAPAVNGAGRGVEHVPAVSVPAVEASELQELEAERMDALQARIELLERDRDNRLRDALARLRALESEREASLRASTEAQVRLESAQRERDAAEAELRQAGRLLAERERAAAANAAEIKRLASDVQRERERGERHEHTLEHVYAETRKLRQRLDDQTAAWLAERKLIGEYVDRAATSRAWRIGHRLTSLGARLTFRRNRGTSALGKIQQRLQRTPDELGSSREIPALTAGEAPEPPSDR